MAKNDRYYSVYLKKINGSICILVPRSIVTAILFTHNCAHTKKVDSSSTPFLLSFSYLNEIGDWYETVGGLHFYKAKNHPFEAKVLKKSLCKIHNFTYANFCSFVKQYKGVFLVRYTPSFIRRVLNNMYTTKLFSYFCQNSIDPYFYIQPCSSFFKQHLDYSKLK